MATKKRTRSDSVTAAAKAFAVVANEIKPPAHVQLRPQDKPFWNSIVCARAYSSWTDSDLELAANLARCKSDIERLQNDIDKEGDVLENQRGTPVVNPKHQLLETLSRRSVALSRMLHVHAEATQGESREQAKRKKPEEAARQALDSMGGDALIAPPMH
jgi:hypothetical protein